MKAFEEEREHDEKIAWRGYFKEFAPSEHFVFKHFKGQRKVKCVNCGIEVPKEIPRVRLERSWGSYHYCLKCALFLIKENLVEKQEVVSKLSRNIKNLEALQEIIEKTIEKKEYKDVMDILYLCNRLEGKQNWIESR